MRYFKSAELTLLYGVSEKTIRNWIAASMKGSLDLKLLEDKGKHYIADSTANNYLLEQLSARSKKYRNSVTHKIIEPTEEFKSLFAPEHVIDIANTLDTYHELSWSHSYFGRAGVYWNQYLNELHDAGKPNMITNSVETLHLSTPYIDELIKPYAKVNVVNVAIGNNIVVRDLAAILHKRKKLKRFIAVDISPQILDIAEQNAREWFGNTVKMEKHCVDIRNHTFGHIINAEPEDTINLVFFTAGPLHNFKDPRHILRMFNNSMGKNDLLFTAIKRDTNQTRRFFDFNIKADNSLLGVRRKMLLELLNIDDQYYTIEQIHTEDNDGSSIAIIQVRLRIDLTIKFHTVGFQKNVELYRGDTITLWRGKRYNDETLLQLFGDADLSVIQVMHSLDKQLTMQISRVKTYKD